MVSMVEKKGACDRERTHRAEELEQQNLLPREELAVARAQLQVRLQGAVALLVLRGGEHGHVRHAEPFGAWEDL